MALMDELSSYPLAFQKWAMANPMKVAEAGDVSAAFNEWQLPQVNGQQYYAAPDQASVPGAWSDMIGNSQITLPDGRTAIPNSIAKNIADITNKNDMVGNFLNGPGALGLAFGPAAAGIAAGGFAGAGAAAGGADALGAELAGYWNPATSGIGGSAASIAGGPSSSYWNMLAGEAPEGGISGLGDSFADPWDLLQDPTINMGQSLDPSAYGSNLLPGGSGGYSMPYVPPLPPNPPNGPMDPNWTPQTQVGPNGLPISTSQLGSAATGASALQRLLSGNASPADYASLLGILGATGLGAYGANQQQNAYKDAQDQWLKMGDPSRARFEGSFAPGFNLKEGDPAIGQMWSDMERQAAGRYGNVAQSPSAQSQILGEVWNRGYLPQLNTYRSQNLTGGQLGTNIAGTASLQGASGTDQVYRNLAGGLGELTNPASSFDEYLKKAGLLNNNYAFNTRTGA